MAGVIPSPTGRVGPYQMIDAFNRQQAKGNQNLATLAADQNIARQTAISDDNAVIADLVKSGQSNIGDIIQNQGGDAGVAATSPGMIRHAFTGALPQYDTAHSMQTGAQALRSARAGELGDLATAQKDLRGVGVELSPEAFTAEAGLAPGGYNATPLQDAFNRMNQPPAPRSPKPSYSVMLRDGSIIEADSDLAAALTNKNLGTIQSGGDPTGATDPSATVARAQAGDTQQDPVQTPDVTQEADPEQVRQAVMFSQDQGYQIDATGDGKFVVRHPGMPEPRVVDGNTILELHQVLLRNASGG